MFQILGELSYLKELAIPHPSYILPYYSGVNNQLQACVVELATLTTLLDPRQKPFWRVRSKAHDLDNPWHSLFGEIDSSARSSSILSRDEVVVVLEWMCGSDPLPATDCLINFQCNWNPGTVPQVSLISRPRLALPSGSFQPRKFHRSLTPKEASSHVVGLWRTSLIFGVSKDWMELLV